MILILFRLHLEDVGDDAVNLDVADQAGEEEVLQGVGMKRAKGGEKKKEPLKPLTETFRDDRLTLDFTSFKFFILNHCKTKVSVPGSICTVPSSGWSLACSKHCFLQASNFSRLLPEVA